MKNELIEIKSKNEVEVVENRFNEVSLVEKKIEKIINDEVSQEYMIAASEIDSSLELPTPFLFTEDGEVLFDQDAYDVLFSDDLIGDLIQTSYGYDKFPYSVKKRLKQYIYTYIAFIVGVALLIPLGLATPKMLVAITLSLIPLPLAAIFIYIQARWMYFYEISGIVTNVNFKMSASKGGVAFNKYARKGVMLLGFGKGLMYKTVTFVTDEGRLLSFDVPDTKDNKNLKEGAIISITVSKGTEIKDKEEGFHIDRIIGYQVGAIDKDEASVLRSKGMNIDDIIQLETESKDRERIANTLEEQARLMDQVGNSILIDNQREKESKLSIENNEIEYIEEKDSKLPYSVEFNKEKELEKLRNNNNN